MTPEFSRRFALDTIGTAPRDVAIEADVEERAALARRFGLVALDHLGATATLVRDGLGIAATGRFAAGVIQICVVTGDPVPAALSEDFTLRFIDAALLASDAEEIELSDADCDVIECDGGAVDLGEAVAQSLGLALDPFPRSPAAGTSEGSWSTGPDAGPFAALKKLR
jgi:uncharacterized metal-binding protein YceD (DUF177 family)